jgi:hypothetical protein
MVFFPVALIRFSLIIAMLYGFLLLCIWVVTYAIIRECFSSALCFGGLLLYFAAGWVIQRRLSCNAPQNQKADTRGGGFLLSFQLL